jgi:hypothetical protein
MTHQFTTYGSNTMLAIAVLALLASAGCDRSTTVAGIAPAGVPAATAHLTTAPMPFAPSTYCASVALLTPSISLLVASVGGDVAVDELTLHLLDGTNVGGPGITIPRTDFTDAIVRAGTSRTFVVTPTFKCGVSSPQSIHGDVVLVDSAGLRTSLSTTAPLR